MRLVPLGEMELTYVGPSLDFVDLGAGGQYYAAMEGRLVSQRISGQLRLTNLATKRPDQVNTPALRGILLTDDGATLFVEMNGLSQLQQGGRVFVTSLTFRTAHPTYQWANTTFGVVEGVLQGVPRPNEFSAHCRVFVCEATISTTNQGGKQDMPAIAYALTVRPEEVAELRRVGRERSSWTSEPNVKRDAAFHQRTPYGSQLIIYREFANATSPAQGWLPNAIAAGLGAGQAHASEPPAVEILVREPAPRHAALYAAALPLLPGKTSRIHEFASELNGIHAAEFQESLRRLGFGLTLFVQYAAPADLVISVVEGNEPERALERLAQSAHPFDRWHLQQIVEQTGLDLSAPAPPVNEVLWSFEPAAAESRTG